MDEVLMIPNWVIVALLLGEAVSIAIVASVMLKWHLATREFEKTIDDAAKIEAYTENLFYPLQEQGGWKTEDYKVIMDYLRYHAGEKKQFDEESVHEYLTSTQWLKLREYVTSD